MVFYFIQAVSARLRDVQFDADVSLRRDRDEMLFQRGHVAVPDPGKASIAGLQEALEGLVRPGLIRSKPEAFRGQAKEVLGDVERTIWGVSAVSAHVLISLVSKGPGNRRVPRKVYETIMVNISRVPRRESIAVLPLSQLWGRLSRGEDEAPREWGSMP